MRKKILELILKNNEYISGEEISSLLGISRTAVWKNINKLKEEGYVFESSTKKGYRLIEVPNNLNDKELSILLNDKYKVYVYDEVDSTNSEAKRISMDNKAEKIIVIGNRQTAGKGRRGRIWESYDENGIWFSILIRPNILPQNASMLTLIAGLSVVNSIKKITNLDTMIKWPNDIVINGRKISGILTEMSSEIDYINYVIIGIGINLNNTSFSENLKNIATSIYNEIGMAISKKELFLEIIQNFDKLYNEFLETENLEKIISEYNQVCINIGRDLIIEKNNEKIFGTGVRVNSDGELVIKTLNDEIISVSSGEVSVRGIKGYC